MSHVADSAPLADDEIAAIVRSARSGLPGPELLYLRFAATIAQRDARIEQLERKYAEACALAARADRFAERHGR